MLCMTEISQVLLMKNVIYIKDQSAVMSVECTFEMLFMSDQPVKGSVGHTFDLICASEIS